MNGATIISGILFNGIIGMFFGRNRKIGSFWSFILGAVIGPIGWIVAACSPKNDNSIEYDNPKKNSIINIIIYTIFGLLIIIIAVALITQTPSTSASRKTGSRIAVENIQHKPVQIPNDWTNYTVNNAFILSVPPTIELRHDYDIYTQRLKDMKLNVNSDVVVFQQNGLANATDSSKNKYCRIMIQYIDGNYNDYYRATETDYIDTDTKGFLYEMAEAELGTSHFIGDVNYAWTSVGKIKALKTSYTRSGFDGASPVACQIYLLFNNKEMVKIVMSYRESESNIWKSDFEKIVKTFNWKQIY